MPPTDSTFAASAVVDVAWWKVVVLDCYHYESASVHKIAMNFVIHEATPFVSCYKYTFQQPFVLILVIGYWLSQKRPQRCPYPRQIVNV